MAHAINWIKFKVQKALGIHELIEKVEFLENEIIRLNIKAYAAEDEVSSTVSNINKLFATTSVSMAFNMYQPCNLFYHQMRSVLPPFAEGFTSSKPPVYLMCMQSSMTLGIQEVFYVPISTDAGII